MPLAETQDPYANNGFEDVPTESKGNASTSTVTFTKHVTDAVNTAGFAASVTIKLVPAHVEDQDMTVHHVIANVGPSEIGQLAFNANTPVQRGQFINLLNSAIASVNNASSMRKERAADIKKKKNRDIEDQRIMERAAGVTAGASEQVCFMKNWLSMCIYYQNVINTIATTACAVNTHRNTVASPKTGMAAHPL